MAFFSTSCTLKLACVFRYKLKLLKHVPQYSEYLQAMSQRWYRGPASTCPEENPTEPHTLFVCEHGGMTPVSADADLIYRANKSAIEQYTIKQILPSLPGKGSRASDDRETMSDKSGFISRQSIRLSMAEQIKPTDGHTVNFDTTDTILQQAAYKQEHPVSDMDRCDESSNQQSNEKMPANDNKDSNLPSNEQLEEMKAKITEWMPQFFMKTHRFNLYSPDIVFENNYWGANKVTHGINAYAWELLKLRLKCNIAYASINVYIIKITSHPEEGTIKVRWTMKGLPQMQAFMFWKWNLFNLKGKGGVKDKMRERLKAHDGFNTFWLNKDGCITKHRLDKVMPEQEKKVSTPVEKLTNIITSKSVLEGQASTSSTTGPTKCETNS